MGIYSNVASPIGIAGTAEEENDDGVLDIFGNAVDDLKGIAAGFGNIGGAIIHDATHAVTLGQVYDDFVSDDIVKAMPGAIAADYEDRYGGGLSGILHGIVEHPLSFLGDALTVATAGGYAVAKSAATAAKGAEGLGAAAAAAKATSIGEEVALANRGIIAAEDVGEAAKWVQKVQGVTTKMRNPLTGRIEEMAPAFNPVKRYLYQKPTIAVMTDSGGRAAKVAEKYMQAYATLGPVEGRKYAMSAKVASDAIDAAAREGARVVKPAIAKYNLRKFADLALGTSTHTQRAAIGATDKAFNDALKPLADAGMDAEAITDMVMNHDTSLLDDGYAPAPNAGPRDAEHLAAPKGTVETTGKAPEWGPDVTPDEAREVALNDRDYLTGPVREALGEDYKVLAPEVKSLDSIKSSGVVSGGGLTDDISRYRILHPNVEAPDVVRDVVQRLEAAGVKVRRVENTVFTPDGGGERYIRLVAEAADGHPIEFQLATPGMSQVLDAVSPIVRMAKLAEAAAIRAKAAMEVAIKKGDDKAAAKLAEQVKRNELIAVRMSRESQTMWGGVTAEVREALGGHADNVQRKALHQLRVAVAKHVTNDELLNGSLDPIAMFDDKYMALRYKNGAQFKRATNSTVGGGDPLDLHAMNMAGGTPQPVYVPLVSKAHAPGGPMLGKVGGQGELSVASDSFLKKNTGELLSRPERLLKDLPTVYHMRAVAHARAQATLGLMNQIVGKTGRVIEKFDDAGVDEVVLSKTHLKNLFSTRQAIEDAGLEDLGIGRAETANLESALKEVLVKNQDALSGIDDPDLVAVPSVVYGRLQQHAKNFFQTPNIDLAFRKPMDLWKGMVLAGSPRWVLNNIVGNILFLKNQGGKLSDVVRQLSPRFRAAVDEAIGEEARKGVVGGLYSEVKNQGGKFDDYNVATSAARRIQESRFGGQSPIMRGLHAYSDAVRRLNGGIEDAFRKASYLTGAEKVAEEASMKGAFRSFWSSKESLDNVFRVGNDERLFGKAVDQVNKYLNDYSKMTPFGKNVLRPYVAPFWSFYRHAAKTLLTLPFDHPGRARIVGLVNDTVQDELEKLGDIPPWLEGASLPLGETGAGDMRFLSTSGPNPFNAVLGAPGQLLAPPWKVLFEQSTGVSSFTGRAFSAPDVYGFGSNQYKVTAGPDGEPIVEDIDKVTPGLLEHLLQSIPQYEMVKDIVNGGSSYDTATLLQAIKGDAVIRDPETGETKYPRSALETLGKLFGYSTYDVDIEGYQSARNEAIASAITQWQNRQAAEEAS